MGMKANGYANKSLAKKPFVNLLRTRQKEEY